MYQAMSCGFQSATVSSYMTVEDKLEEQGAGWFSFESTPKKKKKWMGGKKKPQASCSGMSIQRGVLSLRRQSSLSWAFRGVNRSCLLEDIFHSRALEWS